jgi:hypothetical protein
VTSRRDTGPIGVFCRWSFLLACGAGILIALVDSSPGWDDTGVTVATILGASALFGAFRPDRAISSAFAVGIWVPAFEVRSTGNFGSLLALAMALAGSGAGAIARMALQGPVAHSSGP